MTKHRLKELLDKSAKGILRTEESIELDTWYKSLDYDNGDAGVDERSPDSLLADFKLRYLRHKPARTFHFRPGNLAKAAIVTGLLFTASLVYYYKLDKKPGIESQPTVATNSPTDVEPGKDKAILVLGDGSKIDINESSKGLIAEQGSVQVIKDENGYLRYDAPANRGSAAFLNKLITPRGGEHKISLPDGTVVWLNASSSITFPSAFFEPERRVSVTGEVYFEVARNEKQPFIVKVNSEEVKVLGTHFNINAYTDEGPGRVTLIEGAVQVSNATSMVRLKPGQQSHLHREKLIIEDVDIEQVTAWKSGFFELNHSSLEAIMRAISRWYDVDVVYETAPQVSTEFGGRISKRVPLTTVLDVLRSYGIDCRLDGKKLFVRS